MKITTKILNILLILAIIIGDVCYTLFGGLWLKGMTSLMFVLLGGVNLTYMIKDNSSRIKFGVMMLIGLFVCFVADIVLNLNFMIGAVVFALGHVFYILAYCNLVKFKWSDLIPSAIIFIPVTLLIIFLPIFNFGSLIMEIICIMYALIISIMVGKCISNLMRERTLLNLLLVIGSVLFMFSDLMLLFDNFADVPRVMGILCLATYYPGQAMLGGSLFYARDNGNSNRQESD